MNKFLLIAFGVLAVLSIVAAFGGKEVGYDVAIKHIPKYSKYGYGIGQSVRYDKRIVPGYVPKKFVGEGVGFGYDGYEAGFGGLGLGDGVVGLGGFGLGVRGYGLGRGELLI